MAQSARVASSKNQIIELRRYQLRNTQDGMLQRTTEYFRKAAPAMQRAGAVSLGFFTGLIAEESPFLLLVRSFANLAAWEAMPSKLSADKEIAREREAYLAGSPGYVRLESSLLRAFDSTPAMETPPAPEKGTHVFELRTYESNTSATLARKIKMFNDGEIAIFRRLGMRPVFFGETLVGRNMPNLTYMLAYASLAAREQAWTAFGADPEWQKMRAQPGLSDGEIVSNISNSMLRPLPFSAIR